MTNQLFEKAKRAVAQKHGYRSWYLFTNRYAASISDETMREVAEWMCNEAVKADRATIRSTCLSSMPKLDKSGGTEGYYWIFDGQKFQELEIPFPQQPDGI